MKSEILHFRSQRAAQDLVLGENHRVLGKVTQFLTIFQLDGIRFLYKNFNQNQACILNDESGLGKTAVVGAFLSSILPADNSKRCLIIVKDNEHVTNWRFHLDVLTKLHIKQVSTDTDIDSESNVFLVTWETIRKFTALAKVVFNCVILDDRGDLTASRSCLNFFLRHFENRISLIVASSDMTLDIKQLHSLLRLCGRLDQKYHKLKLFEEKFSLPDTPVPKIAQDRTILEAYFQRREKIINYCRDFRLRRYRHQFEDVLPLVTTSAYEKSLEEWRAKGLSNSSSLSSGSLKILSSSSEKNTEELFQTYFDPKTERLLNDEVRKINENAVNTEVDKEKSIADTEEMSPLLFESDTEELIPPGLAKFPTDERKECQVVDSSVRRPIVLKPIASSPNQLLRNRLEKIPTPRPLSTETSQLRRGIRRRVSQSPKTIGNRSVRSLRSADRRTRKTSQSASRNAIVEVFRMVERAEAEEKKSKRRKARKTCPTLRKTTDQEFLLNVSSDSEYEMNEVGKLQYCPDAVTRIVDSIAEKNPSSESKYNFDIDLINRTPIPDSSEVQICALPEQIVILSSSTESSENTVLHAKLNIAKKVADSGKISPSPDIFENYDEYDFVCSQRGKFSFVRDRLPSSNSDKWRSASCLDRLENEFRPRKKHVEPTNGFADLFPGMVQLHTANIGRSTCNDDCQPNKITRYLSSQSLDFSQFNISGTTGKDVDNYPKTPQRRVSTVSQRGSQAIGKKSPKSQRRTPVSSNGLTKWLIKGTPENDVHNGGNTKTAKRKRLDLMFKD